jgi:hypothetical protein
MRLCDEVSLGRAVDEARGLGDNFRWQDELNHAEVVLYEMTCSEQFQYQ